MTTAREPAPRALLPSADASIDALGAVTWRAAPPTQDAASLFAVFFPAALCILAVSEGFPVLAGLAIALVPLFILFIPGPREEVELRERGVLVRRGERIEIALFSRITSVRAAVHRSEPETREISLATGDAETMQISHLNPPDHAWLRAAIEESVGPEILAHARARATAGGRVPFGHLAIDREFLWLVRGPVSWSDVRRVREHARSFSIELTSGEVLHETRDWFPDVRVFVTLANELIAARRGAGPYRAPGSPAT